jgi:hypothetical protein
MFKIYPECEFEARCPEDDEELVINDVVIPGMRCLADTECPGCGNKYFVDLPVGQAIWSPCSLNQVTNQVYVDFNITWFSNLLIENYQSPSTDDITPIVHKYYDAEKIIIINCLDFLYGHSLLKLLNVQRYLENETELGCCVLVPTQLVHLVPEGVAEIWEFPVKIKEGRKWYPSLNNWLKAQITSRKECFLSKAYSHPGNKIYDLRRFAHDLPDITEQTGDYKNIILFNYREDRIWGKHLQQQQVNIQKLYDKLSALIPDMGFVLVGFGNRNQFIEGKSKIIDLRAESFELRVDRLWMAYMCEADCVIGVHGSNMLLPSGLAKSTIELVPTDRIMNSIQSFLFSSDTRDIRDGLLRYRLVYGDERLSDVYPSQVVDLVVYLLFFEPSMEAWFKVGEDDKALQKLVKIKQDSIFKMAQFHMKQKSGTRLKNKIRRIAHEILWRLD